MHRSLVIRKQNVSDVQNGYFEIFRIWGKMSEFELNTSTVADDEAFCWFCWFFTTSFSLLFFFSYHRPSLSLFQLTGSQESMLRVDQEDPFTDIFFYDPDTPPSPSTVLVSTYIYCCANDCHVIVDSAAEY